MNPTPPEINEFTFDGVDYKTCELNVPVGAKTLYWLHPYWEKFFAINEMTEEDMYKAVDVEEVKAEEVSVCVRDGAIIVAGSPSRVSVFGINGQKVYDGVPVDGRIVLDPGIYVVKVGNMSNKVKL